MPNVKRLQSEIDIYHITNRGVGRQIIFEDDDDRQRFVALLHGKSRNLGVAILAWCLMDNHVHILIKEKLETIAQLMLEVNSAYSHYFNRRHDRVGRLFQGRYGSTPINSEKQLIATIRYIHRNPVEAGSGDYANYPWSSYREYLEAPKLASVEFFLELIGGKDNFALMHAGEWDSPAPAERNRTRTRISDKDSLAIAQKAAGEINLYDIKSLPKTQRNSLLKCLYAAGLTVRQIERLTGVGRSIIDRASKM